MSAHSGNWLFQTATPGDILRSCEVLDRRMAVSTQAIDGGGPLIDQAFVDAWRARLRRWAEVRAQCGDSVSRLFYSKWKPILDDWRQSQAEWESEIERRTGRALAMPAQLVDEDPFGPAGEVTRAIQIGVAVVAVIAVVAVVQAARK